MLSNIILITIDTLRRDHLGCYGYGLNTSPNIDRMAEDALVFEQAITNGSYTKAAFPPILSSTYASMYGGPFENVSRNRPMLAGLLQRHGYQTAGVTANPLVGATVGYDQGFSFFSEPVPPKESRQWLKWKGMQRLLSVAPTNELIRLVGLDTRPHPVYVNADVVTKIAIDWLQVTSGPFFLWVHYMDPHWPYHDMGALDSAQERARSWSDLRAMSDKSAHPGIATIERVIKLYDAGIQLADRGVGELLGCLSDLRVIEETAIIVTSDHGEAFYEHGRFAHGALFDFHEEIVRVPLIVRLPKQATSRRVTQQVQLMDLSPTLLDVVGLEREPRMEGHSWLEHVESDHWPDASPAIIEMMDLDRLCVSVRTPQFKYLFDEHTPSKRWLFRLDEDPAELADVFGQYATVERDLEEMLQAHLERVRQASERDPKGSWSSTTEITDRLRALGYID